jgi:hypothetical protein
VLSGRNLEEVAGDSGSREWKSRPSSGRGKLKAAWLADAVARLDQKKAAASGQKKNNGTPPRTQRTKTQSTRRKVTDQP